MALDNNKLKRMYDTLKRGGYTQDYDTFVKGFAGNENYANRRKVYDLLTENGANIGATYEEFMGKMQEAPKVVPPKAVTPVSKPTQKPAATDYFKVRRGGKDFTIPRSEIASAGGLAAWANKHPGAPLRVYMHGKNADGTTFNGHVDLSEAHDRRKNRGYIYTTVSAPIGQGSVKAPAKGGGDGKGYRPSLWQMHQLQQQVAAGNAQLQQQTDDAVKRMDAIKRGNRPDAGLGTVKINPKSGKVERQYTTVQGQETGSRMEQSQQNTAYNAEQGLLGQLRIAYKEREELNRKAQARLAILTQDNDSGGVLSSILSSGDPMMGAVSATTSHNTQRVLEDPEYQQYRQALRELNSRIQTLENERYRQGGGDVGFWRGFGQTVSNVDTV